jgi:hypothetical protein
MDRVVVPGIAALYAYAVASRAYRFVASRCRDENQSALRPIITVAAAMGMAVCAYLVPWIVKLEPPWSESPAGIFAILGKLLLVATLGLASLGAWLGAWFPNLFSRTPERDA